MRRIDYCIVNSGSLNVSNQDGQQIHYYIGI
jgi:hypothetical protein